MRIWLATAAVLLAGCTVLFESTEGDLDASLSAIDGSASPSADARSGQASDANTSAMRTLTIVVVSDVGGQVSFTNTQYDGEFCNAFKSPCLFALPFGTPVHLYASTADFSGYLVTPACLPEASGVVVDLAMLEDCTVEVFFGGVPL